MGLIINPKKWYEYESQISSFGKYANIHEYTKITNK